MAFVYRTEPRDRASRARDLLIADAGGRLWDDSFSGTRRCLCPALLWPVVWRR